MRKAVLLLTVAFLGLAPAFVQAAEGTVAAPTTFSDAQRAEIENIIKDYLGNKHPEVMQQGLQALQQREQENIDAKSKAAVVSAKERIYNDPNSPISGNPKGDVVVVEFYDYQCGYCKMSEDAVDRLLKEDKKVKFIHKDFPILGPVSAEASKAALASVKQGKFQSFHDALMSKKDHLSSDAIYQSAKDVGLDVQKLKKDMEDSSITDILTANLKLGQEIGARGTPMFIVNDDIYPGAMQPDQLKKAVADARIASQQKKP